MILERLAWPICSSSVGQRSRGFLLGAPIPNCKAYVTLMNENDAQRDLPAGTEADMVKGCY